MNKKSVHFSGIAGNAMAPIAKMFKDMGWQVTGSDQKNVFPPITTYLKENEIDFVRGYSAENLPQKLDLVVVGRSALMVDKSNPEILMAQKLGCRVLSYPEVLSEYLIKQNSIVVVGTYGKTTSTALIAWILDRFGLSPSFMIGSLPLNFLDGVRNTNSSYSVVEGDEPPALRESDPSKFMFYKPKFVMMTAAKWDHPEIFKTEAQYLGVFKQFVCLIPPDGFLTTCLDNDNTLKVAKVANCPILTYSVNSKRADYWVENVSFVGEMTNFEVVSQKKRIQLQTNLLGEHNIQNITGAVVLCLNLGISVDIIQNAVVSFKGIRMRLEKLGSYNGIELYADFAQHPARVKESLSALRQRYPDCRIYCIFDPHSSTVQRRESLEWYFGSFDSATQVIITKVTFPQDLTKEDWVKGSEIVEVIARSQPNVFYEPIDENVSLFLKNNLKSKDVVVFMSSGGLRTPALIQTVKDYLEGNKND